MAKWLPGEDIGPSEVIGRRLYDDPVLKGAEGQPPFGGIKVTHFLEKRSPETSLDRLGQTGVDKSIKGRLCEQAENQAAQRKPPRAFQGWAAMPAKAFAKAEEALKLTASPITEDGPDQNIFHAHVIRPEKWSPLTMAMHLRHLFELHGKVEASGLTAQDPAIEVEPGESETQPRYISWIDRIMLWLRR